MYAVGDYCIYANTVYKCITAITTPENWDNSKWASTNIATELNTINSELLTKQPSLFGGTVTSAITTDLNDLETPGLYWIDNSVITNNPFYPEIGYGILEVGRQVSMTQGVKFQRFTAFDRNARAQRIYANSRWYPWKYDKRVLWSGSANAEGTKLPLKDDRSNYDFLIINYQTIIYSPDGSVTYGQDMISGAAPNGSLRQIVHSTHQGTNFYNCCCILSFNSSKEIEITSNKRYLLSSGAMTQQNYAQVWITQITGIND